MSFVILITGANGALGTGIIQRLIEEYDQLDIVLACRNLEKAQKCIDSFQTLGKSINFHRLQIDLTDAKLDFLVLNAGVMPLDGLDLKSGIVDLFVRPGWVAKTGGNILRQTRGSVTKDGLGLSFAANLYGHYILATELQHSLEQSKSGKIIWLSSTTAAPECLDFDDEQCLRGEKPYESSKRLGELVSICLDKKLRDSSVRSFIASPGNLYSELVGAMVSAYLYIFALYIMRLFGCSGININGYNAATSIVDLIQSQEELDPSKVYHSEINIFGQKWTVPLTIQVKDEELIKAKQIMDKMDLMIQQHK
ncbi:hypothetical protein EDD86DRAFT_191421 [Gorgonomyces haynaldii]|nr:hypothetical protein EDD86DRAFT_191421 [Gorgonomyces haynaldii]